MVQIINVEGNFAMIGGFYTKKEFRGQGFGLHLFHCLTSKLFADGYVKCGLVSDSDNLITTRIFSRIGFRPVYRWGLTRKET